MRFAFLLLVLLSTPALATNAPIQKEFRAWLVTCDNLRRCVADGTDAENASLAVRLSRDAGSGGSASLTISGMAGDSRVDQLRLDGKALPLSAKDWYSDGTDEDMSFETGSSQEIQALITKMRNGNRLALGEASVSLDGLSAALLLIDDVQGRVDTGTAWIRAGAKSSSGVPAAPIPPGVVARPFRGAALRDTERKAVLAAAIAKSNASNDDCDVEVADQPNAQIERLSERDALVLLECYRGAYQSSYFAYRVPIAQPAQARKLVLPSIPGSEPMDMLTGAEFDARTGTLSHVAKLRGIGDCGESAQWLFDGQDFVLTTLARQPRCSGLWQEFPVLWRNR